MDIVLGILAVAAGLALCFSGLRVFFVILPIAGFVVGFFAGAGVTSWLFGDGFLSTALGIVIGLVLGLIFSALSYLYWYIGVILAAGGTGAVLGAGLFAAFGVSSGWLLFIFGLIGAILFAFAAIALAYPVYLVIFATALQGAVLVIGGVLLVFNRVDRHELIAQQAWERINDNWFLWIVWIVVAAVGIGSQLQATRDQVLPANKWEKAQPA